MSDEILGNLLSSDLVEEENYGYDELDCIEVAENHGLRLLECNQSESADIGVDEEVIYELFPDAILREGKVYLIEKDNKIYYS